LRRRSIPSPRSLNLRLSLQTKVLGRLVRLADVGELVAHAVGDDVGVQSVLLTLGDESVGREESALVVGAVATAELEVDAGVAEAEVCGGVVVLTGEDGRGGEGEESEDVRELHFDRIEDESPAFK